jgi:hypothetical protein
LPAGADSPRQVSIWRHHGTGHPKDDLRRRIAFEANSIQILAIRLVAKMAENAGMAGKREFTSQSIGLNRFFLGMMRLARDSQA